MLDEMLHLGIMMLYSQRLHTHKLLDKLFKAETMNLVAVCKLLKTNLSSHSLFLAVPILN